MEKPVSSVSKKFLAGLGWLGGSSYITLVWSFLGNLLLARILIPEDFGTVALASAILAFVFMIAGFGSQEAIVQFRSGEHKALISTSFWMTVGLSLTLALAGSVLALALQTRYDAIVIQLIVVLAWMTVIKNIAHVYTSILLRSSDYRSIATTNLWANVVSYVIAIAAALSGLGVWSLVIRELVATAIQLFGYRRASSIRPAFEFDFKSARAITAFGWRVMILRIQEVLFGRIDNFAIGTFLGVGVLGQYNLAYRLTYLGNQLAQSAIQPVLFSTFSELQASKQKLLYAFERITFWLFRIVIVIGLFILLIGAELVTIIYGDKWADAGVIFSQLFLLLMLIPLIESTKEFLIGAGYVNSVVLSRLGQLIVFISFIAIGTWRKELTIIVIGVNLSAAIAWLLMLVAVRRAVPINIVYLFLRPIAVALLTFLAGYSVKQQAAISVSGTILVAVVILLSYCIMTILFEYRSISNEIKILRNRIAT